MVRRAFCTNYNRVWPASVWKTWNFLIGPTT